MQNKKEFVGIIQKHEGLIYKVVKLYADNREDQQDLYQEIVYQLWKSFEAFRNESKISTWMYRVALNTSIAHLNKVKRRGIHISTDELDLNKVDFQDELAEEQIHILYTQIKKLNPIEKGIILLFLEGKTYEEISIITGFTVTNVATRLARIKQKIKDQIKT